MLIHSPEKIAPLCLYGYLGICRRDGLLPSQCWRERALQVERLVLDTGQKRGLLPRGRRT